MPFPAPGPPNTNMTVALSSSIAILLVVEEEVDDVCVTAAVVVLLEIMLNTIPDRVSILMQFLFQCY